MTTYTYTCDICKKRGKNPDFLNTLSTSFGVYYSGERNLFHKEICDPCLKDLKERILKALNEYTASKATKKTVKGKK
jgi:hypothetical protein